MDLRDERPLLQSFRVPKTNRVHLDMYCVKHVNATGLNLFFSGVAKTVRGAGATIEEIDLPNNQATISLVKSAGASKLIGFNEQVGSQSSLLQPASHGDDDGSLRNSQIFNLLNKGQNNRTGAINGFRNEIKGFLESQPLPGINSQQLLLIFSEMAKNTLDHSQSDASLGIDVRSYGAHGFELVFSYCEQGLGLSKSLRNALRHSAKYHRRSEKGSFSDLVHWALQPGNSTKTGNGVNFGLGMTMILS
jgi:hypothetical protein